MKKLTVILAIAAILMSCQKSELTPDYELNFNHPEQMEVKTGKSIILEITTNAPVNSIQVEYFEYPAKSLPVIDGKATYNINVTESKVYTFSIENVSKQFEVIAI